MTTGAQGTPCSAGQCAPDVSGVLAAWDEIMFSRQTTSVEDSHNALQQAAEQACYRYAASILEAMHCISASVGRDMDCQRWAASHPDRFLQSKWCERCRELMAVRQLLAGSA